MRHKILAQYAMMALRLLLTVMPVILFLSACKNTPHEVQDTRFIMGTMVSFMIIADQDTAENAIVEAANTMQDIEHAMTIYGNEKNAVKRFNHAEPEQTITLPPSVDSLLQMSHAVSLQTDGAFSASLGMLSLLWGFSLPKMPITPPSPRVIAKIMASKPANCLSRVGVQQWQRSNSQCVIDLGGIAKGYALDQGMKVLKSWGIADAMINAGGDIRIMGMHGERPWRIGIRDPRHNDKVIGVLALSGDKSVVTSGDYERFFMLDGRRYHHILDPKTGYPVMRVQSSTIVASTASKADVWSTALFVAGSRLLATLEKTDMMALVVDAKGRIHAEQKMRQHLQLKPSYSIVRITKMSMGK
ncbi:MAG: FAD:protein FMN transferase [Mariprofundaceae bacterium]|nr:FAD:protein FMN transferase [Mariprofundaceae bacterium]